MDLSKLSMGEKIAAASAALLFIFMFFSWFDVEATGGSGVFTASASGSVNAWDALDNIPIFLVIVIVATLGVAALRLADSELEPTFSLNAVIAVLGGISVLLILYRIIDPPGGGSVPGLSVDVSPTFGIFLSLISAGGIAYGGYRAMQEEGVSFADAADRLSGGSAGSGAGSGGPSAGPPAPPPPPPPSSPPPPPPPPPPPSSQPPSPPPPPSSGQ